MTLQSESMTNKTSEESFRSDEVQSIRKAGGVVIRNGIGLVSKASGKADESQSSLLPLI